MTELRKRLLRTATNPQVLKLSDKENMLTLNTMAGIFVLDDELRQLADTTMCRHEVKVQLRRTRKVLEPYFASAMDSLFDACSEEMEAIIDNKLQLISQLMQIRPENWQYVAEAAKWANNPTGIRFKQLQALCVQAQNDPT